MEELHPDLMSALRSASLDALSQRRPATHADLVKVLFGKHSQVADDRAWAALEGAGAEPSMSYWEPLLSAAREGRATPGPLEVDDVLEPLGLVGLVRVGPVLVSKRAVTAFDLESVDPDVLDVLVRAYGLGDGERRSGGDLADLLEISRSEVKHQLQRGEEAVGAVLVERSRHLSGDALVRALRLDQVEELRREVMVRACGLDGRAASNTISIRSELGLSYSREAIRQLKVQGLRAVGIAAIKSL